MYISLPIKPRAGIRVHKSYEFLEKFYEEKYPRYRLFWAITLLFSILVNLWLIFM